MLAAFLLLLGNGSAAAVTTGWQLSLQVLDGDLYGSTLLDVSVVGASSVWAVGYGQSSPTQTQLVEHWDGMSWHSVPEPVFGTGSLNSVAADSDTDVWVSGSGPGGPGYVARWDGTSWLVHGLSAINYVNHLAVFGPDDVYALGLLQSSGGPGFEHWDGASWTTGPLPALPDTSGNDPSSPAWAPAHDIATGQPRLLHFTGTKWVLARAPKLPKSDRSSGDTQVGYANVVQDGPASVWLTVERTAFAQVMPGLDLWHWDGKRWTRVLNDPDVTPNTLTPDGTGGVWLLTGFVEFSQAQQLLHIVGGQVVATVDPPAFGGATARLRSIAGSASPAGFWAVGDLSYSASAERYRS